MSDTAINVTPITRVFGMKSGYESRTKDYDAYTMYLVNDDVPVDGSPGKLQSSLKYSDLYYGDRRVTDLIVLDKLVEESSSNEDSNDSSSEISSSRVESPQDIIKNPSYPDGKMYLVPHVTSDVWRLNGETSIRPSGFDIYYKYRGVVTPVTTSVIAKVNYIASTVENDHAGVIQLTFNTTDGDGQKTINISDIDTILSNLGSLDQDVLNALASNIFNSMVTQGLMDELLSNTLSDINSKIGNVPSNGSGGYVSLQSQIDTLSTNKADKTYVDTQDNSLQSQINTINSELGTVIPDGQGGFVSLQSQISTINSKLGTVITDDQDNYVTLQSQITNINNQLVGDSSSPSPSPSSVIGKIATLESKVNAIGSLGDSPFGYLSDLDDKLDIVPIISENE